MFVFWVGCQDQHKVEKQAQSEQKTDLPEDENLPVISEAGELKAVKAIKDNLAERESQKRLIM